MDRVGLRLEVEELYAEYAAALDDGELERWPELFTAECLYEIMPRDNFDRGLPLALMRCESRGMLRDRVAALRQASVYAPRALRHLVSGIRIAGDAVLDVRASYAVFETPLDEETRVLNVGRYLDKVVRDEGRLRFVEKRCVFDSVLVPGSLVYPL
jgi:3-phenylpropionate/cinnamic acid dioxygenase small subunit